MGLVWEEKTLYWIYARVPVSTNQRFHFDIRLTFILFDLWKLICSGYSFVFKEGGISEIGLHPKESID
jgi:hypothetical protein